MSDNPSPARPLTRRQRLFVEEYLTCWNASEASRRAGYTGAPDRIGPRLLGYVGIKARIESRLKEKAMTADEVIERLAQHARGDMGDFMDISSMGFQLDLANAKELGLTHLIHKAKQRTVTIIAKDGAEEETNTIEIELYDAQAALVQLGRHLQLFTDNVDIKSGGEPLRENDGRFDRAISTLADAIREAIPRADAKQTDAMVTSEQTPVVSSTE